MKRYNKFIFILFVTAILSGIAASLEAQNKPKNKYFKIVFMPEYLCKNNVSR